MSQIYWAVFLWILLAIFLLIVTYSLPFLLCHLPLLSHSKFSHMLPQVELLFLPGGRYHIGKRSKSPYGFAPFIHSWGSFSTLQNLGISKMHLHYSWHSPNYAIFQFHGYLSSWPSYPRHPLNPAAYIDNSHPLHFKLWAFCSFEVIHSPHDLLGHRTFRTVPFLTFAAHRAYSDHSLLNILILCGVALTGSG